jgi:hypothetical protein
MIRRRVPKQLAEVHERLKHVLESKGVSAGETLERPSPA